MDVYALCPFRVGTLLWEAQPGQLSLTVTVKATFTLAHGGGELEPAPVQDEIGDERHWDDQAIASLRRPGDVAPLKRRVDVTLSGHAYAPGGVPARTLTARLRVGDLDKAIRITGDRLWTQGPGGLTASLPIPFVEMPLRYERAPLSADNPVGFDVDAPPSLGASAGPNLEREDAASRGTVGFGPIAPTWRARRKLLDKDSLFWAYGVGGHSGGSLGAAPPGFNFEFFNAAPRDQQLDLLRAGAPIELENLDATRPRLEARVPSVRPQVFRVQPRTGRVEEIILRCDTLWIDCDRAVLVLTFRGLTDLTAGEGSVGKIVVAADPQGKKLRFDKVEQQLALDHPGSLGSVRPMSSSFEGGDPLAQRYDSVKPSRPASALPPSALAPPPGAPDLAPLPPPPPQPVAHEPTTRLDSIAGLSHAPTLLAATPQPAAPPSAMTLPSPGVIDPRRPGKPSPPRPTPAASADPPPESVTIEGYARISVELAQKGEGRDAVLRRHQFTIAGWGAVERHWKREIAEHTERGDRGLLLAFDAAYLAAQEQTRPPVGIAEYARILVGLERGEVGRVLADLDLQLTDLMRLQRVWTKKVADEPALAATLAKAMEGARRA